MLIGGHVRDVRLRLQQTFEDGGVLVFTTGGHASEVAQGKFVQMAALLTNE